MHTPSARINVSLELIVSVDRKKEYINCFFEEIKVSDACKFTLFDMLCLHNGEDVKEKPLTYEDFYIKGDFRRLESDPKYIPPNTWR
jgi:hypothetical protein